MRGLRRAAPRAAAELSWQRARVRDPALRFVDRVVGPGQVVLDVGANRGTFTARLQRLVGSGGRVLAFEPNPVSLRELRGVALAPRTTVHPVGLSDRSGSATLIVPVHDGRADAGLGSLEVREEDGEVAPVAIMTARLDDVVTLDRLDFVKIDVEGHEHRVLLGARSTLQRHRPTLLVEIEQRHRREPIEATFALLAKLGYTGWAVTTAGLQRLERFDLACHQPRWVPGQPRPAGYVSDFVFTVGGSAPRG